jgi:preprotein translocase subunit SecA
MTDRQFFPALKRRAIIMMSLRDGRQTVRTRRIVGCPHEEEVDYPLNGVCPHCPFWATHERFTHQLLGDDDVSSGTSEPFRAPPKVGRNDPCPCGSGKKYKKCCGK